MYSVDVFRNVK